MTLKELATVTDLTNSRPPNGKSCCSRCEFHDSCLPSGLKLGNLDLLHAVVQNRVMVRRGDYLYRMGTRFSAIYAIRSGSFKGELLAADGRRHVTGFHMAGELLGLDGVGNGAYASNAIALETGEVCQFDFAELERAATTEPALQRQVHMAFSRAIVRNQDMLTLLTGTNAYERVATLLLRLARDGHSGLDLQLKMNRDEFGSCLGLTSATVTRVFKRLQDDGIVSVRHKRLRIRDMARLEALGAFSPPEWPPMISASTGRSSLRLFPAYIPRPFGVPISP